MELPALQGSSTGEHPPLALSARQTDTSQGLLCTDSYNQKSFSSKFGSSVESGTLHSGQVCREAGWHLGPCLCPWAAVDCEPLFHCANVLFSLHGSDLGTSDVPVTGWFICPKTLQSAHHNVHLLWQLIYPTLAKMSMNYLPYARIPLALLTFHQRLDCLIKQSIVENEKSKQTVGVIAKKT